MSEYKDQIQQVDPTTYKVSGNEVEVVIGDEKQSSFFPRVKLKKWNNEVNFSLGLIDADPSTGVVANVNNEITWTKGSKKAVFYGLKKPTQSNPTKLKWIDLSSISPSEVSREYELSNHISWDDPTLVTYTCNTSALMYFGQYNANDYVDYDTVDIPQVRAASSQGNPYYMDKGLPMLNLHYNPYEHNLGDIDDLFKQAVIDVFKSKYDIDIYPLGKGNKLYFKDGQKDVKLYSHENKLGNLWTYINIDNDYNKAYDYYKPGVEKGINDEFAYGIKKVHPSVDYDVIGDIVARLSKLLKISLEKRSYTLEEKKKLGSILPVHQSDKWVRDAERSDLGWYHETKEDGFEFSVIYDSKPSTNIETLSIETKDLRYLWQGDLSSEDRKQVYRSPNVINSYAVYHTSKRHGKYVTGKAFHIYRPFVEDANGWKVWCDLGEVDTVNNELKVTIPQDFLDTAVYPVRLDPTFGYTTIGGSSTAVLNTLTGSFDLGADALLGYNYVRSALSSGTWESALYNKSDGTLHASSFRKFSGGSVWNTFDGFYDVDIDAVDYFLCVWCSEGGYQAITYDVGSPGDGALWSSAGYTVADGLPSAITFTTNSNLYSIYYDYHVNAEITPTFLNFDILINSPTVLSKKNAEITTTLEQVTVSALTPTVSSSKNSSVNVNIVFQSILAFVPVISIKSSSIASPQLVSATLISNTPTASTSVSKSASASTSLEISTIIINTPSISKSVDVQAVVALAESTIIVNQPTIVSGQSTNVLVNTLTLEILANSVVTQITQSQNVLVGIVLSTISVGSPITSTGGGATAVPALSSITVQANTAIPSTSVTESAIATPNVVTTSILVNTAIVSGTSGVNVTATLVVVGVSINQPTVLSQGVTNVNVDLASSSVDIFEPLVSTIRNNNVLPDSISSRLDIGIPQVSSNRNSLISASLITSKLLINDPTINIIESSNVNALLAQIRMVINNPTASTNVFVESGIVLKALLESKINKKIGEQSRIEKFINEQSKIECCD